MYATFKITFLKTQPAFCIREAFKKTKNFETVDAVQTSEDSDILPQKVWTLDFKKFRKERWLL